MGRNGRSGAREVAGAAAQVVALLVLYVFCLLGLYALLHSAD